MTGSTELAKGLYSNFGRGDIGAVLGAMRPDVEITYYGEVPWAGSWKGADGAAKFFTQVGGLAFEVFEPQEYIEAGSAVTVTGRTAATVRATGARFDNRWAHIITFSDDKIARFVGYDSARIV